MREIKSQEMKLYIGGGISLNGALLSGIRGFVSTIFEIGQTVGGAIRRIASGNLCKF